MYFIILLFYFILFIFKKEKEKEKGDMIWFGVQKSLTLVVVI
jgi:hypothetical protein